MGFKVEEAGRTGREDRQADRQKLRSLENRETHGGWNGVGVWVQGN